MRLFIERLIFLPALIAWIFFSYSFDIASRITNKEDGFRWSWRGVCAFINSDNTKYTSDHFKLLHSYVYKKSPEYEMMSALAESLALGIDRVIISQSRESLKEKKL